MSAPIFPDLAIFSGSVCHCRHHPHRYRFRQPLLMLFVNAARLEFVHKQIFPLSLLGILNWRRKDYLPSKKTLTDTALQSLQEHTGIRATGPVYVLAQPRQFGVSYNPATFYFICDGNNNHAAHLLVEVHNTPWGERFCYAGSYTNANTATCTMQKQNRVSPFNPPQMTYQWRYSQPQNKFFYSYALHKRRRTTFKCHFTFA